MFVLIDRASVADWLVWADSRNPRHTSPKIYHRSSQNWTGI